MVRLVCWNLEKKHCSWRALRAMEHVDVALLQETRPPPPDVGISRGDIDPWEWPSGKNGRAAVVRLSNRVDVEFIDKTSYAKSDPLCIAAACVRPPHDEPFIVVSICPDYETPHPSVPGKAKNVDSSLHRTISDLSAFIGAPSKAGLDYVFRSAPALDAAGERENDLAMSCTVIVGGARA